MHTNGVSDSISVVDLFAGAGGLSHGLRLAGDFEIVSAVENDLKAAQTYQANHVESRVFCDDIRELTPQAMMREVPLCHRGGIDVVVGGPPCQGFTTVRPFRSTRMDDPRNTLFEQFAWYVAELRPSVFVMENVVGLVKHKQGDVLRQIRATFESIGYHTEWQILNAVDHGVPQARKRFFLIGTREAARIVFPEPTHAPSDAAPLGEAMLPHVTVEQAISDLPPVAAGEQAAAYACDPLNSYQAARRRNSSELTLHQASKHTDKMLEIIRHAGASINDLPEGMVTSGFASCYSRIDATRPAVTLTSNFTCASSHRCIHPIQDRSLTLREGARLQSFDDDYRFIGNRTQIAKQIGNAVPPLLGQAIGQAVKQILLSPT